MKARDGWLVAAAVWFGVFASCVILILGPANTNQTALAIIGSVGLSVFIFCGRRAIRRLSK